MKCPRYGNSCGKFDTVRHCPGCPLRQQKKEARQARLDQSLRRREARQTAEQAAREPRFSPALPPVPTVTSPFALGAGPVPGLWDASPPVPAAEPVSEPVSASVPTIRPEPRRCETSPSVAQRDGDVSPTAHSPASPAPASSGTETGGLAHSPGFPGWRQAPVEGKEIIYHYDGSLVGLYCCIHESLYFRELPVSILPAKDTQPSLLLAKEIIGDREKAAAVRGAIAAEIAEDALSLIETVFCSCLAQKELRILRFVLLGRREGRKVMDMLAHPDMVPLFKAERHLLREAHLLKGFVRFSDYDGVLAANITPKNNVLPFLAGHFRGRFAEERFIIYDKTHKSALICQDRRISILPLEEMPFPEAGEAEEHYQALWKNFYHTIAIEARINPRLRMSLMPKRYWENMTEMQELL